MSKNQWIEEDAAFGEKRSATDENEWNDDVAGDRSYGVAVAFDKAFSLVTVVKIAERMVKSKPLLVFGFGLAIMLASQMRIGFQIPLPRFYDLTIIGDGGIPNPLGLYIHQSLFNVHLGILFGGYVVAGVCAEVGHWVRGDDPDFLEVFANFKIGLRGMVYEVLAMLAVWAVCLPFLLIAILAAHFRAESVSVAFSALVCLIGMFGWLATRPGLWAMAVDDLPARYALMQSIVVPLRHPITVIALFVVAGASTMVGMLMCGVGSFLVAGAFQCGLAGAWVLFGARPEEIDKSKLLRKIVKIKRTKL